MAKQLSKQSLFMKLGRKKLKSAKIILSISEMNFDHFPLHFTMVHHHQIPFE